MVSLEIARKNLENAIDDQNIENIKLALKEYADLVQQVKLQICARELLSKLLTGHFDESMKIQIQKLVKTSSDKQDINTKFLEEFIRYKNEVDKDNSAIFKKALQHIINLKNLVNNEI